MALIHDIDVSDSVSQIKHIGGATFGLNQQLVIADTGFQQFFPEKILSFQQMIDSLRYMELLDNNVRFDTAIDSAIFLQNAMSMSITPCTMEGALVGVLLTLSAVTPHHQAIIIDRFTQKIVQSGSTARRILRLEQGDEANVNRWKIDLDSFADQIAAKSHPNTRMMIMQKGVPIYIGVRPLEFVDSANRFISLYITDLNEEILQEQLASERNDVAELIVQESNDIVVLSTEGLILGASGALMKYWGWNTADLQGRPFITLIAPSDKEKVARYIRDNVDISSKIVCIRSDGTIFEAAFTLTPYEDESRFFTLIQIELEESTGIGLQTFSRYISMINSLPALIAVGNNNELIYANKYFLDFFRCASVEEFKRLHRSVGDTFTRRTGCLYPVEGVWLTEALAKTQYGTDSQVMIYSEPAREYRTFSLKAAPLADYNELYVFLFADITDLDNYHSILQDVKYMLEHDVEKHSKEKQNVELLLKQQQELLVQQSKLAAMGKMIGIIAHQWKQPLNVIGLMAQNLAEDFEFEELSADNMQEYTSNIMKQVRYMAETIDDFSGFFRPSKTVVQFDLSQSVDSVANLLRSFMTKNNVVIDKVLDMDDKPVSMVLGYPNELKQVLMNIMNNAKDAIVMNSAKDEISDGRITVTIGETTDNGYIKVADTGGGIPPHIMDTLFEPYITTKGDDGTGIGLYMSKYIMEQMNGSISVENSSVGAVFTIKLPKA
jgi:PAS domain S-box-containing protein